MKKVVFFHTTPATVLPMKHAFEIRYPDVQLISFLDDSILPEVMENNNLPTPAILRRFISYAAAGQEQGAQVIVCMCTTLGLMIREAQKALDVPIISIDQAMLREAVSKGNRIAMLITFAPTACVSRETALAFAKDAGRETVTVDVVYVDDAREALNNRNTDLHDQLICSKAECIAEQYDLLVFAQVSMADAACKCRAKGLPVLCSKESGIEQIAEYLKE